MKNEIKNNFLKYYSYNEKQKIINSSSMNKFFKDFPIYKEFCENVLKNNSNFKTLNSILKCIVFDITLPKCKICNKEISYNRMMNNRKYCSLKCAQNDPELIKNNKEKIRKTCLEKYGVDSFFKSKNFKEKSTETCLSKYGCEFTSQTSKMKEKSIETCLSKYGYKYANQSDSVKEKIRNTFNENKNKKLKEIKEKIKNTNMEKYGVEHHMKLNEYHSIYSKIGHDRLWKTIKSWSKYLIPLFEKCDLDKIRSNKVYKWKCVKCGNEFESHIHKTMHIEEFPYLPRCLNCYPYLSGYSNLEKEVLEYIKSIYSGEIIENSRKFIKPYELDIVLPELKLAIEFNGNHWHEEGINKPIGYHAMKTNMCKEINFKLIHIWEDEWINEKDSIKEKIKNAIYKRKN